MTHRQTMSPRFAYPLLREGRPGPDPRRDHRARLPAAAEAARLPRWSLPGSDRWLISFRAESVERAEHAVDGDPFIREELLQAYWLKQWTTEGVDNR